MNIYKPCYNSFCEPAATERRSKKTHGLHRCTRSLWHGFFDLCLLIYIWILNGFASVTACGWFLTTNLPNPTNIYHVATYKIRQIRAISVRKKHIRVWIILSWPQISRIPRIYTGSQPKQFVRFVRLVFEKNIFAYELYSVDHKSPESHKYTGS